jgi:pyroglutamyl-peptidase
VRVLRVLLLGFGPFSGAPINPSALLVEALRRRRRPALANVAWASHVLATAYAAVDRDLPRLLAGKPDIVLIFGLAARTPHVRIETHARNAASVLFPDARGQRPRSSVITMGGPSARRGRAPFAHLLGAARRAGVPARLSRDAGRYLCNYAYWRVLEHGAGGRPLVQFVHIPAVTLTPQRRARRSRRLSLTKLVGAAEALLIALIAASRR